MENKTKNSNAESNETITFSTFVFSLSSSTFLHFGDMPNPQTGVKEMNLPAAKQSIDIIAMLQEKTKGNLTSEEESFVDKILYDLRMKYMDIVKSRK